MKRQLIKVLLISICMLAAGICYSCDRNIIWTSEDKYQLVIETDDNSTMEETEINTWNDDKPVIYYVHICGEVKEPGVYEAEAGSRIFQVIELAGGFTEQAAKEYLNIAQEIQDGMKVWIPSMEELADGTFQGENQFPVESELQKVNLNTATKEQLMTLRGIGESRAQDIIQYREKNGPFQSIEEIMEISGIKDAAFQKIKDDITV